MYKKELQDELFESLLKAAVIENALEEMDEWIDDETIVKEIEVPKSYDDRVMKTAIQPAYLLHPFHLTLFPSAQDIPQ